ncbi:MAG TPA: cupin domain-containing protein [Candidatus Binatia bacterium]|nr:cupin domain-containing protein [Candidatus Binatia bacterium]
MEGKPPGYDDYLRMYMEMVRFAKDELERRERSPVYVPKEKIEREFMGHNWVLLVDPRIGFNARIIRFWINGFPPGEAENQWKTMGHRHTVEAVIYVLKGHGYSIIDGVRYDWEPGDFICVPVFAWHRHINLSNEDMVYVAATTGPLSMGIGVAIYEDERYPEYWVFAQNDAGAKKSLIPGATEIPDARRGVPEGVELKHYDHSTAAKLYFDQLAFAEKEEQQRRKGRVLVKGKDLKFERTPMGWVAAVVDPQLGFHVRVMSTLVAEIEPGKRSGAHRHLYEEINHILSGEGYSIIEDKRYEWKAGDTLAIPVFSWHQHFNTGKGPARILAHTGRPAMENIGLMITQQGELAEF